MTSTNSSKAVTEALEQVLADSYILYLKTQNYHWNVTGPQFIALHKLLEEQYVDLIAANDEIAERIRALGEKVPASFAAFGKITKIKEETGFPDYKTILKNLVADQDTIVETAKDALEVADETDDQATVDLMNRRILQHQKNKWMLSAHLE